MKCGIYRPSRCNLFLEQEEASHHLFLDSPFTIQVWNLLLGSVGRNFSLWANIINLITKWKSCYPGRIGKKKTLYIIWNTTHKNVYWKIWLAINRLLFYNKKVDPKRAPFKAMNMISKKLNSKRVSFPHSKDLSPEEHNWWLNILSQNSLQTKAPFELHN